MLQLMAREPKETKDDGAPPRGRPATGRKTVLQVGFFDAEMVEIERVAGRDGKSMSAMARELALEGLAARKKKGK